MEQKTNKKIAYFVKEIIKIIFVLLSVFIFLFAAYESYTYLNSRFRTKDVFYNDSFHNMPENSLDAIVLGSSHAQYSFVPNLFYQKTGLYSYVLGTPCQPYEISYEMLQEALKTQKPKLLIMEAFTAVPFSASCLTDGCYVMASYEMRDEQRKNALSYLDEEKANIYRNEFLNNHSNWKNYDSFIELKNLILGNKEISYSGIDDVFGYHWSYADLPAWNYWHPIIYSENLDVELDDIDLEMLNNIKSLCDQNDITMVMYMVPFDGITVEDQAYRYKIWEWCEENNVLYQDQIDLAPDMSYNMIIHNDGAHSYTNGAALTTSYLADMINENYQFEDHKENDLLDELYRGGNIAVMMEAMRTEYDPLIYGRYLDGYNGIVAVSYNNNGRKIDNRLLNDLYGLGLPEGFEKNQHCYALLDRGEIIDIIYSDGSIEYKNNKIDFYDWGIMKDGDLVVRNNSLTVIMFNDEMEKYLVKDIELSKYRVWEKGYNWYAE